MGITKRIQNTQRHVKTNIFIYLFIFFLFSLPLFKLRKKCKQLYKKKHPFDKKGNSPHSSYAMFAQSEYPPPNGYPAYNPAAAAYHYSNPYINPAGSNGYPLSVTGDYNPNTFGMPPPQHLPQDIKISKDR